MDFQTAIRAFRPTNEQERADRDVMLTLLGSYNNLLSRSNQLAHFTSSAWVVNRTGSHVLMAYHNIYRSWAWLGGHADGCDDLARVALREVHEETGVQSASLLQENPISLEVLTVSGHEKRRAYVPSHLHLNLTYLVCADMTDELTVKEDENSAVAWIPLDDVLKTSSEPWFVERIYPKLIAKTHAFTFSR